MLFFYFLLNEIKALRNECSKYPSKYGGPDLCSMLMNPYAGCRCFKGDDESAVNSALSQIDSSIELLYIHNAVIGQKIDFNKLPSQMIVVLSSSYDTPQSFSSIDWTLKDDFNSNPKSFFQLFNEFSNFKPKEEGEELPVRIVGNISSKVSTLILTTQEYQIVDSDLMIDNLILAAAPFNGKDSPNKIMSNILISDISNFNPNLEKIETNHLGYYIAEKDPASYTINFHQNEIEIYINDQYSYSINYNTGPQLDLIINADEITFNVSD